MLEVLFINQSLGYSYELNESAESVKIIDSNKTENWFSFAESPYYSMYNLGLNERIILQISFSSTHFYYIVRDGNNLCGFHQKILDKTNFDNNTIEVFDKHLKVNKTGLSTATMYIYRNNKRLVGKRINGLLSRKLQNEWIPVKLPIQSKKILGTIKLENTAFFITYYPTKESISLSKVFIEELDSRINSFKINNRSNVQIEFNNQLYNFDFRKKETETVGTALLGSAKKIPNDMVLTLKINKQKYYLYSFKGRNYATTSPKNAYGIDVKLKTKFIGDNVLVYGRYHNSYKNFTGKFDYIYIKDQDTPIAKFNRPFSKKGKSLVYAKIPLQMLTETEEIHRGLYLGDESSVAYPFYMKNILNEDFEVFGKSKRDRNIIIFRANVGDGTSCTILPFSEEYSIKSTIKQNIARTMEKNTETPKTNVYFEKFSAKADESAIKVFDKALSQETSSENYFILDEKCADFPRLKKKYKKYLIKKYSLKHYRLIYRANCFISTEFSNHVINDRIFINKLRKKITDTPLIFLQHGIMYAKPIENPMATGFHKKNIKINLKKVVISSELEAQEFYKVGYKPDDLLLSGLATFDNPVVKELDKYAYMPTYRYWEEHMVYEDRLEETSYYRDIMNVIEAFETNGLLDKLLIVPHNKFANYIVDHFPDYKDNICTNPSEALTKSQIFITDYSSAIYDAINRGAYPIFWWKEKEMLIEKYQAIPSLNEETAPGPIAYNEKDLIHYVINAEKNKFQLEQSFMEKYRKINKFSDNQNTERIIEYLRSQKII
ncbi:CDP-glycerol glycerophosphotransferase family protein [Enterococcus lactis]|uniref:CDP-glycerol glycerophosphotransferase family protein n=1 Tax=Enterococcus lactis TaxID=357441 RepID=UPI0022E28B37|nr:CDP-glycerol glycerophosphotransferase family protein [Enterococcus lactis]